MAKGSLPVVISRRAEQMLLLYAQFLPRVTPTTAQKFIVLFSKASESIAYNPLKYPFVTADKLPINTYRKCLFYNRYQITYLLAENKIYIDSVLDCR